MADSSGVWLDSSGDDPASEARNLDKRPPIRRKISTCKELNAQAAIFNQVDLCECSVAECGSKNAHAFQVITPYCVLVLAADNRKEMEDWMHALKTVSNKQFYESGAEQYRSATSGEHTWYVSSHTRPTYCNYCRDTLSGVAWNGLSCEVCKMKVHKRCAVKVAQTCKWTTYESINAQLITLDEDGSVLMPHQWQEGNLAMSAKCCVCERTCGSVLRLQDWRCLWCNALVHTTCRESYLRRCPFGSARLSVLPPVSVRALQMDGSAELCHSRCDSGGSPLLVLVNSKSGDNHGVRVLRRFKRLLNPAQVYDLMAGGPEFGLRFFRVFDSFRVLVCGGDGTVGWVLSALDRLQLHSKCWLGILPLGTGNDLARVMGWGHSFDDNTDMPHLLEKYERAHTQMLDRWSVLMYEGPTNYATPKRRTTSITCYEDSIATHLSKILSSDDHSVVISSAKVLCETVKDILTKVSIAYDKSDSDEEQGEEMSVKCVALQQKLDNLLKTLKHESQRALAVEESGIERESSSSDSVPDMSPSTSNLLKQRRFVQRDAIMSRANSLKKAVREIIEHAERAIDEQNLQTEATRRTLFKRRNKWQQRRSTTSPCSLTCFQKRSSAGLGIDGSRSAPAVSPVAQSSPVSRSRLPGDRSLPQLARVASAEHLSTESSLTSGIGPTAPDSDSVPMIDDLTPRPDCLETPSMVLEPPTPCMTPSTSIPSAPQTSGAVLSAPLKQASDPELSLSPCSPALLAAKSYSDSSIYDADQLDDSVQSTPSRKISRGSSTMRSVARPRNRTPLSSRGLMPVFRRGLAAGALMSGSLIAEVLLLNADVLGVCGSPLMDFEDIPLDQYEEKKVMNNYLSIGLDAKIAFEFHKKREEYADRARSRSKLYMWYATLGGKELLQRTYKNLEQRVHLECDGHRIRLPSLQGIVILNIPSYQAGIDFWGSIRTEHSIFSAQSYDDRVLEVIAVFGVMHCATSRVIRLQNHRIAQCRHVKIIITGDEPVAVQVDGEPWMQPPGYIQIVHKNRAQVLVRNPQFEATLKTWTEKQARDETRPPAPLLQMFSEEESHSILNMIEASNEFIGCVRKECPKPGNTLNQSLRQATLVVDRLHPATRKLTELAHLQYHLSEAVASMRQLVSVVECESSGEHEPDHVAVDDSIRQLVPELERVAKILSLSQSVSSLDKPMTSGSSPELYRATRPRPPPSSTASGGSKSRLSRWLRSAAGKFKGRTKSAGAEAETWTIDAVGRWLDGVGLAEYRDNFAMHEISGRELLKLERRDLKDLGVTKVGHIKRLQSAIHDLSKSTGSATRARSKSAPYVEHLTEESISSL